MSPTTSLLLPIATYYTYLLFNILYWLKYQRESLSCDLSAIMSEHESK